MGKDTKLQLKKAKPRIKDLPEFSRPREKLFATGAKNLSEAELLAILLGTGTPGQNAILIGQTLLRKYPGKKLFEVPLAEFVRTPGIGKSKASRIMAALELGERFFAPKSLTKVVIQSAEDVIRQVADIAEKKQEYLLVLYLNARHELLQKEVVGVGTLNSLRITPKEILSPALSSPCASIILVHNHPSGDPTPSDDDIAFTARIHEAGEIMGVPLVDHLIIAKSGYFSFREEKL